MRVLIPLFLVLIISCSESIDKQTENQNYTANDVIFPIDTQIVRLSTFNREIESNAKIKARRKANLFFRISEQIEQIYYQNGDFVPKDSIVATLKADMAKYNYNNALIALETAENKRNKLIIEYGYSAANTENIPEHILQNIDLQSNYSQARNAVEMNRLHLEYCTLRAPFSGLVANLNHKTYNLVSANNTFCTIIDTSRLEAEFQILESELSFLQKALPVSLYLFDKKTIAATGTISEINPVISETGLIAVKALIDKQKIQLYEGQNIRLLVQQPQENCLKVPKTAVVTRSEREVVFTYDNGLAKWNDVEIGGENTNFYMISSGLQTNDTIISEGNLNLAHDSKVSLQ